MINVVRLLSYLTPYALYLTPSPYAGQFDLYFFQPLAIRNTPNTINIEGQKK
jgi:hypothetical protein